MTPTILLYTAERWAKARRYLVEDQHHPLARGKLAHALQIPGGWTLRAQRLHDDGGHFASMLLQEPLQRGQVTVRERVTRAGQPLRHPDRLDPRKEVVVEPVVRGQVGGQIPVMPAVVTAKQHLVPPRRAARDAYRDSAGLATALGIAHHLGARDRADQLLGQLDLPLVVEGIDGARVNPLLDGSVHYVIGIAQDDGPHGAHPIEELVAIHVPDPRALGPGRIDGADTVGKARRPPADELRGAGNEVQSAC